MRRNGARRIVLSRARDSRTSPPHPLRSAQTTPHESPVGVSCGRPSVAIYVGYSILLGKILQDSRVPRWKAWIPIYNFACFMRAGGESGWWLLVSLVPAAGPIFAVYHLAKAASRIGSSYGKDQAWVALFILANPIWLTLLAGQARQKVRLG